MKKEGENAQRSTLNAQRPTANRMVIPKLEIPEGFVSDEENKALAAAQDVIAKVLARYDGASRAACRKPDCAPTATLKVNGAGAAWVINAHTPGGEAHGWTLEAALRNLADQTDAERLRRDAALLRFRADELERRAAGMEWPGKNPQLSTLNAQLSTLNSQLSTGDTEPETGNPEGGGE